MKRYRIKLLGFGCAVLAGSACALARADDWQPAGQPAAPRSPVPSAPIEGEPAALPGSVRLAPPPRPEPEPLWFPTVPSLGVLSAVPPPEKLPDLGSSMQSVSLTSWTTLLRVVPAVWPTIGPRIGTIPQSPPQELELPGFVPPPTPLEPPRITLEPTPPLAPPMVLQVPPVSPSDRLPPPRPVEPTDPWLPVPPRPMPTPVAPPTEFFPPRVPEMFPPETIRPVVTPKPSANPQPTVGGVSAELPVAPAELMVPIGAPVPGKHGTFGSAPITISRDYPSWADIHGGSVRTRAGLADATNLTNVGRGYVQAEFLLWWAKSLNIPILGTTSTNGGFGFLGQPGTVPILGPGTLIDPFRQGFRARAGYWFDDCGSCGIDGSVFFLGRKTANTQLTSDQFPIITRPIFSPNIQNGQLFGEFGETVTRPGILTGSLNARADSFIWGADANIRKCLASGCDSRATWFVGYRNLNLLESLSITENINVVGTTPGLIDPIGTVIAVRDRFVTENHFHGGQLGATYERRWGRLSFDARGSVALGVTHQELSIDGFQNRTRPGMQTMVFQGGLLAAGPNLGTFTRNQFSVAPEATLNLGYWVTPNFKLYTGYNAIYWSNVIRPGDQIDRTVDVTFVPNSINVPPSGQNRPRALFKQSDMFITGVQFGMEWRW